MKIKLLSVILLLKIIAIHSSAHAQHSKTSIEWKKFAPADPRLIVKSGYLIVSENRLKPNGTKVKIPFIFIRRPEQDARKNISLYSVGGPGYSTTSGIDSIGYEFGYLKFGGTIMFSQRGTKDAIPSLACPEIDEAVRQSYRSGKDRNELLNNAVRAAKERLIRSGIDLSAYNTLACAEDINDLRLALGLDSLNLIGLSYSGGLMMTVAKLHPEAVRTLILRSPLPSFVNYEEDALTNFNEALEQIFINCKADSTGSEYGDLKNKFQRYFTRISGEKFSMKYLEKGTKDSLTVTYDKSDLLDIINSRLSDGEVSGTPKVIIDMIGGKHQPYISALLDGYFKGNSSISRGMRYSVFCSEQVQFTDYAKQKKQNEVLPWLNGYRYNDVNPTVCNCWKVAIEPAAAKMALYSSVPTIIVGGDTDPGCSIFYNRLIKRTLPNSQLLIRHNEGHGSGFKVDGIDYLELFLAHPYQKLVAQSKDLKIE